MSNNLRILVVDDFEMMRFQLKKELGALGYTNIVEAADGGEAQDYLVSAMDSDQFGLIFCDWNMPKKTGLEVLEFARKIPAYKAVPFVMVTAEAEQEAVVRALKAGANDYIVKPIGAVALQARLKSIATRFLQKKAA